MRERTIKNSKGKKRNEELNENKEKQWNLTDKWIIFEKDILKENRESASKYREWENELMKRTNEE